MEIIVNGVYEHYKKQLYKVLAVATHSETLEQLVVYQALYGENKIWARPLDMFLEQVKTSKGLVNRFTYIGEKNINNLKVFVEFSKDIENYLFENEIDITSYLQKHIPDIKVTYEPIEKGSKNMALVILSSGVTAAVVILAVNRLLSTIFNRPKYVEVSEFNEDGAVLNKFIKKLEPDNSKQETNIEVDCNIIKLKYSDKSE